MTSAEELRPDVANVPTEIQAQRNWRICNNCFSLFYYGWPTNGRCPAGGEHNGLGSLDYVLSCSNDRAES